MQIIHPRETKILLTVLVLLLFSLTAFAQVPDKTRYQLTVKDANGELVANKEIAVRVSVFKANQNEPAVFIEVHKTATDANGLASFVIGQGTEIEGTLAGVELANGSFSIRTAIDLAGGANKEKVPVGEVQRVPLAFMFRQPETVMFRQPETVMFRQPETFMFRQPETVVGRDGNDLSGNVDSSESRTFRKSALSVVKPGVPAQTWSLFGNSNTDPSKDKLGTTDETDLVLVTNNLDRLRIAANGDINIARSLEVGTDLRVNRNVDLNILGGATVNNGNLTVRNGSATLLTGQLTVNGATNLNSSLDVNNAAATRLTGTLNVDRATTLQSTLDVKNAAATHLTGILDVDLSLNVDGATTLQSTLDVKNAAATHLTGILDVDQTLNVDGATTLQSTLNANGQVTINASVTGGDGSFAAHPLRVQGSDQGIAIKLNAGTPNGSNNFVTFFNGSGSPVGRIEGQTTDEVATSAEFIFTNAVLVAEEAKAAVNVGTSFIPVVVGGVGVSSGPCGACIAGAAADLVLATANLAGYNAFALTDLGVTYESGSADYAEWLERTDANEQISAGDIVGVNGGKVSKFTVNANQYMVISTKPAMLGNMPSDGQKGSYERVAFMGQVPVKVRGMVLSGDYILPSGFNDGTGIAVSRDAITPEQYREIVGVAWSASFVDNGISAINMAIGLSTNDVANLAVQQESRLKDLENKFNALEKRFLALTNGSVDTSKTEAANVVTVENETTPKRELTRAEKLASNMPAKLSDEVMEQAISYLKNEYTSRGINFKNHPGLNKLFTDAAYRAEVIKKAQERYQISYQRLLAPSKNK